MPAQRSSLTSTVSLAPIEDLDPATDFLVIELPAVVERFAIGFDSLPEAVEGVAEARMVIGTGGLVRAFAVYGLLMSRDSVELIWHRDRHRLVTGDGDRPQTTDRPQTDHKTTSSDDIQRYGRHSENMR